MNFESTCGVRSGMRLTNLTFILLALVASACKPSFNPVSYPSMDKLYEAAMVEYNARRWENAGKAFERLVKELPPRDQRLPSVYFFLGKSQGKRGEHLLAAQSFMRVSEGFPQDSLADDALLASAEAYQRMWRKPVLDAQYGESALNSYKLLATLYPDSPILPRANQEITRLDNWFATKDYETGYHYFRRKAYDSAIIYFKDVIRLHPNATKTREAYLRLHESYQAIKYRDDARDLCEAMRKAYPSDREVRQECGLAASAP